MKRENFMLTEHFSYNEMTRSAWAERNGVDNTPDALQLLALENLCQVLLAPAVRPHPHQQRFSFGGRQLWRPRRGRLQAPQRRGRRYPYPRFGDGPCLLPLDPAPRGLRPTAVRIPPRRCHVAALLSTARQTREPTSGVSKLQGIIEG